MKRSGFGSRGRQPLPRRERPMGLPAPATSAQRDKAGPQLCLVCGEGKTDPAHLVPRKLGEYDLGDRITAGCDDARCVVPLCRSCHAGYDGRSEKQVVLLRPMLVPGLLVPERRVLRARLLAEGPETFAGLLRITREQFHPELRHALVHLEAVTLGFPVLRRMLIEGSRIFREDPELVRQLIEIRERQNRNGRP